MPNTDDTTIDDVASEADENDFSDLSDEALDRPPASAGGGICFGISVGGNCQVGRSVR